MKISYNWLKQYINIDENPESLSEILTNIGLEVEGFEEWLSIEGGLEGIVIGEVLECIPHPDADKLSLTKVNIGSDEPLSIVCGAPNVAVGQKVPVATIGTFLKIGTNEIVIKKSKIRGQLSEGMICAEDELGMGDSHEGIMVLNDNAVIGTSGSEYFAIEKDVVFEIGLTPNRIDGGSHFGVARDLAAYLNQTTSVKALKPGLEKFSVDNNTLHIPVVVKNIKDCPRYAGLTISNVTVSESPGWLKNRLRAIGLSPINNIVDITNYVLHEMGQPLHAFDADRIKGGTVIVKNLPDKSKFATLDEIERELSSKDLMICDSEGGMCIGGVFGGLKSGVSQSTKNIFLESAYFNPISIRKSARRHDLNTDASFRFERGVDPANTIWSLKRAAILIKEIAGGEISSEIIDEYPIKLENHKVNVSFSNIQRLIGEDIGKEKIKKILTSLEILIKNEDQSSLSLEVPAYRVDVTREADVIEEILRIHGYNSIEISNKVNSTLTYINKPDKEKVVNTISDMLAGFGFMEIMSNSLTQASLYTENPSFNEAELVVLANPLSSDLNAMRQTLLFGGLSALSRNVNRQNSNLQFFEFGTCYFQKEKNGSGVTNYNEKLNLDLFVTGQEITESWNIKSRQTDFYFIKSSVEKILSRLGIDPNTVNENETLKEYYSEGLEYFLNNKKIAQFGKVSKKLCHEFELKQGVYHASIDFDLALNLLRTKKTGFTELPKYPAVRRDLALLLDSGIRFNTLKELAFKTEKNILREVSLFDVYEDKSLGNNRKSYALSFILRDDRRTLNDKIIDKVMQNLIRVYEKELNASVR